MEDGFEERDAGSFRDPSGSVFRRQGVLYRRINHCYREHYEHLMASGLYADLLASGWMVGHEEVVPITLSGHAYKVIRPELIPFISYPYEWSFSQLKSAALLTLAIQKKALEYGMSLKDCSAYNVQFRPGRPVFIDTLSFEPYEEGRPWVAYGQFCRHFLAPLALMSYMDVRLAQLLRVHIDGVPLDLASALLPWRTRLVPPLLLHLHLHANSQKHYADKGGERRQSRVTKLAMSGLVDSLESAIKGLTWLPLGTEWADYYAQTNYLPEAHQHKQTIVDQFLEQVGPETVWDLGSNTGLFSRLASRKGIRTIAFDLDPAAVEKNYLECTEKDDVNLLPLLLDLTNPSPGIGWRNLERMALVERGPADAVLALGLIHHLSIGNNLPFEHLVRFFHEVGRFLVIEFVDKRDSNVQRLLETREDIFPNYHPEAFEKAFEQCFFLQEKVEVKNSFRTLYLMKRKRV